MKVEQNISRLKYLLTLYKMTVEDLLLSVSEGLKKPLTQDDILSNEINVTHLKRIDKVFNIIAEEEATQILNVVAESIVQYKRKSAKV